MPIVRDEFALSWLNPVENFVLNKESSSVGLWIGVDG